MSIIYDALKKVEQSQNKITDLKDNEKDSLLSKTEKPKIYIFYFLIAIAGFFVANIIFGLLAHPKRFVAKNPQFEPQGIKPIEPSLSISKVKTQAASLRAPLKAPVEKVNEAPAESFILNGIFFSGEEVFALINNQIVKVGDVVEGAVVKQISLEGVELEAYGSLIKLRNKTR